MSNDPSNHPSNQGGFTIVELMIVITIAAILSSLALPALKDWQRNGNRTAVVTTLLATLHLARNEAVKRDARVAICPVDKPTDPDAKCNGEKEFKTGWIVFVDADSDSDHGAGEEVLNAVEPINTNFSIITTNGDTVLYYRPNGRLMNSAAGPTADFNVCDDRGSDQGRVISITNSGRPQSGITAADGSVPQC